VYWGAGALAAAAAAAAGDHADSGPSSGVRAFPTLDDLLLDDRGDGAAALHHGGDGLPLDVGEGEGDAEPRMTVSPLPPVRDAAAARQASPPADVAAQWLGGLSLQRLADMDI
jgi:hypothetical protein